MTPLISIQDLTKVYAVGDVPVHALRGVSLDIDEGEFVTVVGPSGSGKSTFMHIVGCLDRPTAGTYRLAGRDVLTLNHDELADVRNRTVGFVFQGFNLLPRTSAVENVELPLLYADPRVNRTERRRRALSALDEVGLTDRANHHPNQMSGGQQQRVAIARALVGRPRLLLADEPTGSLDTGTGLEVLDILKRLNTERRLTIVLVTHEPQVAEYGYRTVGFRDGQVTADERRAREPLAAALAG